MGTTTPPENPHDQGRQLLSKQQQQQQHQRQQQNPTIASELSNQELSQLLRQRDLEIRHLKLELEKYKLALNNLNFGDQASMEAERFACAKEVVDETIQSLLGTTETECGFLTETESASNLKPKTTSLSKDISSQFINKESSTPKKILFREGSDDGHDEVQSRMELFASSIVAPVDTKSAGAIAQKPHNGDNLTPSELQEMIHDVGEIDLNLELKNSSEKQRKQRKELGGNQGVNKCDIDSEENTQQDDNVNEDETDYDGDDGSNEDDVDDDDDSNNNINTNRRENNDNINDEMNDDQNRNEDMIADGLLTSLSDAAMSNLSQLAALQERCESRQQHQQPQKSLSHDEFQTLADGPKRQRTPSGTAPSGIFARHTAIGPNSISVASNDAADTIATGSHTASAHNVEHLTQRPHQHHQLQNHLNENDTRACFDIEDPLSASNLASQAALALRAGNDGSGSLLAHSMNINSSSSASSNMQVQQDLNSNRSLASVVAAAAAAAAAEAAAIGEHQTLKQHPNSQVHPSNRHHPIPPNQQQQQTIHSQASRLISSAIASPSFYQNLQQQDSGISPISSLHFSPSLASPSPSSLIGGPSHQQRHSASNTSSSILSPIASPNYLRRQFLSDRGMPLMSPSPTSSIATIGSSSGIGSAAGSAHILQLAQHHHLQQHGHYQHGQISHTHPQQRSASALAGPITSQSSSSTGAPLGAGAATTAVSPLMSSKNSSQARLNNMQIRHKFGYLGSGRGQFNSPHGFCLGLNQEIVVADTNNHRVCIFDKDGTYITQFGSPGKEEGQLWNPRKVAILHRPISGNANSGGGAASGASTSTAGASSGSHLRPGPGGGSSSVSTFSNNFTSGGGIQSSNSGASSNFASEPLYVVCDRGAERSRMQLFTKDGAFIKKIGIHYIDIVAGLAITQNGLIIVVDSVSPTVYIINAEAGTLNGWFDCSGHMKEPSDIAVKSDIPGNEYFICDFKGHCVVVFSEQGDFLRKIGHDGLTSYPNGIDISDDGDILVGDSHGNRFHVVVFDRNGNFVSQFECPHVKVSRCCGLKITREGYIVTLAKNNHHVLVLDTIHI